MAREISEGAWWVLAVLADGDPRPYNDLVIDVRATIAPRTIDQSRMHYALKRLTA